MALDFAAMLGKGKGATPDADVTPDPTSEGGDDNTAALAAVDQIRDLLDQIEAKMMVGEAPEDEAAPPPATGA